MSQPRYRILQIATWRFHVQRRVTLFGYTLWWSTETVYDRDGGREPREFEHLSQAQTWVRGQIKEEKRALSKPRVVEYL